jgi:hypothetical protein
MMVPVQVWNIETDRAEEWRSLVLPRPLLWSQLEAAVRGEFDARWTPANQGRFSLYYIYDVFDPVLSRTKVGNQEQLDAYLAFRADTKRDAHTQLFLHVAVILQADGKPVSPVKPPLSINTAMARAQEHGASASASHLSPPDSACSPQSPGTPREKEFRQVVLQRDSDGCVRPDTPARSMASIYRCVFCAGSFLPLPKQIEAAHVVPHAERERLQKALDGETLLRIGGGLEVLTNGVSACSVCHGIFDAGLMWVEQADDAATRTICVDASIRDVQRSIGQLHGRRLLVPSDASFPFPGCVAWRWRAEWAQLKRADAADKVADKLAKLALGGPTPCSGRCGGAKTRNQSCKNGWCKACCDLTPDGCTVHPLSQRRCNAAAAAASAAAASTAASATSAPTPGTALPAAGPF